MPKSINQEIYTMLAAGGTKTFDVYSSIEEYSLIPNGGSISLLNNLVINPTGAPENGMKFIFHYGGSVTIGSKTLTIFGYAFTAAEALCKYTIECVYVNSSWDVRLILSSDGLGTPSINGSNIQMGTIDMPQLKASSVALSKIAPLSARGYMTRGGAAGVVEEFDASTSGAILIGDGTDVISVVPTGDVTISSAGVMTIGAGKVTNAMLANAPLEYFTAELSLTSANILALNGTPQTIVANPGSGKYIHVISATSQMTFVSAAYATNTTLQLINTGSDIAQLQDTAILISTVTKNTKFKDVTSAAAGQTQVIANTALQIKVATGNPITGDSTIKVTVYYTIETI